MKKILDEIKRFKQISGLLLEDDEYTCDGNCVNGFGKYKKGEVTYEGNFKDGKFDGKGTYTKYKDGNLILTFTGTYSKGSLSKGVLQHKEKGYNFDGDFKDSQPYKGTFTKDGITLKGTFTTENKLIKHFISDDGKINTEEQEYNDVFDYITKQKQKNQEEEERKLSCKEGDCENGKGIYSGPLGYYSGYFKNGVFNGGGSLYTELSENEQVVENIDLTKNFHDHKFKYQGSFLDGKLNGHGTIAFSDGSVYGGNFQENQIRGKGVFNFKNGSSYEGIFETIPRGDNYKSTYRYESEDGLVIDDLIKYNKENPIQIITNKKSTESAKSIIDELEVTIIQRNYDDDGNFRNQFQVVNGKTVKLVLKNVTNEKYTYKYTGQVSKFTLGDFKYGNYDYILDVEGMKKIKSNKTISSKDGNQIKFYVTPKKSNMDDTENLNEDDVKKFLTSKEKEEKRNCEAAITEFYNIYTGFYGGTLNLNTDPEGEINTKKGFVQNCITKFRNHFRGDIKDRANWLTNVPAKKFEGSDKTLQYYFDINENEDIYSKTNTMSVSNSLRKVIREYQENKVNLITERKIINNRFKFIVESNKSDKHSCIKKLNEEKRNLINSGYNQKLIIESFIDIASSLYAGQSDVNVLSDLKNKLGQKIADQVKNKETEHELILNAFNQIPDEVIKNSIDKSDVNALTSEIATRALENYKNQFGDGGIGGAFISSIDNEKFKSEVNKILKPAIEGLTSSIDAKVKKIRDIMAGNGQTDVPMSET